MERDYLSIDDLMHVYEKLYHARTKWYNFGLKLKVKPSDLDAIGQQYHNPADCFREVLSTWLRQNSDTERTWATLTDALRSPTVGFEDVCVHKTLDDASLCKSRSTTTIHVYEEVKQKPDVRRNGTLVNSVSTDSREAHQNLHVLEDESKRFKCPCSKCDLITYLDQGCPKSKSNSYPYLPLNDLRDYDKEDLVQKLDNDSAKIIKHFAKLLSSTRRSMKMREITVGSLICTVLDIGAHKSMTNPLPLLEHEREKLKEAKSIDNVFIILEKHMSFFNHEILEHIIDEQGDQDDKEKLKEFQVHFSQFCKCRIFEVSPSVFDPTGQDKRTTKFFVVLASPDLIHTLADVKKAKNKIASLLGLHASTVKLKRIDIGSVILVFSIPLIVSQQVFPLSPAVYKELKSCGYAVIVDIDTPACGTLQENNPSDQNLVLEQHLSIASERSREANEGSLSAQQVMSEPHSQSSLKQGPVGDLDRFGKPHINIIFNQSGSGGSEGGEFRRSYDQKSGTSSAPSSGSGTFHQQQIKVNDDGKDFDYSKCEWFWHYMSRRDCEEKLTREGKIGNFAIRINANGYYIMSLWRIDGVHHHKIIQNGDIFQFERAAVRVEGKSLINLLDNYLKECVKDKKIKPFGGILYGQSHYEYTWHAQDFDMNVLLEQLKERRLKREKAAVSKTLHQEQDTCSDKLKKSYSSSCSKNSNDGTLPREAAKRQLAPSSGVVSHLPRSSEDKSIPEITPLSHAPANTPPIEPPIASSRPISWRKDTSTPIQSLTLIDQINQFSSGEETQSSPSISVQPGGASSSGNSATQGPQNTERTLLEETLREQGSNDGTKPGSLAPQPDPGPPSKINYTPPTDSSKPTLNAQPN